MIKDKRIKRLFASLDKARNTKPAGPLERAKLHDRSQLRSKRQGKKAR
jgi:hypothetical protein